MTCQNNTNDDISIEEEYDMISPDPTAQTSTPSDNNNNKRIGAAAIAGGVAGLALTGGLAGIAIGAIGTGTIAATQNNPAGNIARASGDVVLSAGKRAKHINEKHHVVEKTQKVTKKIIHKGKKLDDKYHVVDKTKQAAGDLFNKTKGFEKKHKIGEKAGNTVVKGLHYVSKSLTPKDTKK